MSDKISQDSALDNITVDTSQTASRGSRRSERSRVTFRDPPSTTSTLGTTEHTEHVADADSLLEQAGPGKILSDAGITSYNFSRSASGVQIKIRYGQLPRMQVTLGDVTIQALQNKLESTTFDGLTDLQKQKLVSKLKRDPENTRKI